jgi:hypothetical protein
LIGGRGLRAKRLAKKMKDGENADKGRHGEKDGGQKGQDSQKKND